MKSTNEETAAVTMSNATMTPATASGFTSQL